VTNGTEAPNLLYVDHVRRLWVSLLQRGRLSPAGYQLLTGIAMLYVASQLWGVSVDDSAAGPVAVVFLVLGVVLAGRGGTSLLASRRASRSGHAS
jgi:hypothetical protein